MSVQTTYPDAPAVAFAGMLADGGDADIMTMISVEASAEMKFGNAVAFKGSNTYDTDALLPSGAVKVAGILVYSAEHQRTYTLADGSTAGDLGTTGLKPGAILDVLRRGRIWVIVETAVVPGDRLYVRSDADTNENSFEYLGNCDNGTDESDMIDCTKQGVFLTTAAALGLAVLEVDFTNAP